VTMNLRDLTRDLHHAAEAHPFGTRMSQGDITRQEWADWLASLRCVHTKLDAHLPPFLDRRGQILLDLGMLLPINGTPAKAANDLSWVSDSVSSIIGTAYIFGGAHLRGGAVMRKRLEPLGFPCSHLRYDQAKEANDYIVSLRDISHAADGATKAFNMIIRIMDEIAHR